MRLLSSPEQLGCFVLKLSGSTSREIDSSLKQLSLNLKVDLRKFDLPVCHFSTLCSQVRWSARMALNISFAGTEGCAPSNQNFYLPGLRRGRVIPLSPFSFSTSRSSPWYFPLLKNPLFLARILWRRKIWLRKSTLYSARQPILIFASIFLHIRTTSSGSF